MKSLADRLRWARQIAGLSARELDTLSKLTPGHTSMIESGRRIDPSSSTVASLARALGTTIDWLVSGAGQPPSERSLRAIGSANAA